jgi:hypothetical protein
LLQSSGNREMKLKLSHETGLHWHGHRVVQAYEPLGIAGSKTAKLPQARSAKLDRRGSRSADVQRCGLGPQDSLRYEYTTVTGSTYAMV